jgi:hypothetical protein
MERAPTVISLNPIMRISFSQWLALKSCPLKAMLSSASLEGRLPVAAPTRASIIGQFHHRAMELVASSLSPTELDLKLEDEIKMIQAKIAAWPHLARLGSVSGWDAINQSASLARELVATKIGSSRAKGAARAEVELRSASGLLVGKPDLFAIAGPRARLREYKSTGIREADGTVKGSYVDQVHFYASLIFDSYSVEAVDASIESLSGDRFDLCIKPAEAAEFSESVATLVHDVNLKVSAGSPVDEFAQPSRDTCALCVGRVLCVPFKRAQDNLELDGEQFVIDGTVTRLESAIRGASATVADVQRRAQIELLLPPRSSQELRQGAAYVFLNLRRQGNAFSWGYTSRVLLSA